MGALQPLFKTHQEYRLNHDGFFIKLVPNRGLRPAAGDLIKGMYLPREYAHFLIGPEGPKGTKGGICITFDGVTRYLTNSEFSQGVNRGWIGTSGVSSHAIKKLIQQYYETGRALLVGYEMTMGNNNGHD